MTPGAGYVACGVASAAEEKEGQAYTPDKELTKVKNTNARACWEGGSGAWIANMSVEYSHLRKLEFLRG